jgi:hypothetical protein
VRTLLGCLGIVNSLVCEGAWSVAQETLDSKQRPGLDLEACRGV